MKNLELEKDLILREYQESALLSLLNYLKALLKGQLDKSESVNLMNTALLEMATGSGKTLTIGMFVNKLIKIRNRFNKMYSNNQFQGLNILVMSNRIDGVEQFKQDFIDGRDGEKRSILEDEVKNNMNVLTIHSASEDSLDNSIQFNNHTIQDNIVFGVYHSIQNLDITSKFPYFDIIIVDEAHNVTLGNKFYKLLKQLELHGRDGNSPLILGLSATPSNLTKQVFGESIYEYSLPEYMSSNYSPGVDYQLILAGGVTQSNIDYLMQLLNEAKLETNLEEKNVLLNNIEELFDQVMEKFPSNEEFVNDLLLKLLGESSNILETIVYVKSRQEAIQIANLINQIYGHQIALSYVTGTESNKALERLNNTNDTIKIVISVGKLNESVDVPIVKNIVFYRYTDIAKIFFQQFGRGLRGGEIVRYFDYVGSLKNIAWIGNIFQQYYEYRNGGKNSNSLTDQDYLKDLDNDKCKLSFGAFDSQQYSVDFATFGIQVANEIKNTNNQLLKNEIIDFMKTKGDANYWSNISGPERIKIFKNKEFGLKRIGTLFGIKGDPGRSNLSRINLLKEIFVNVDLDNEGLKSVITKQEIIEFMKSKGNIDYWKNMKGKDRTKLFRNNKYGLYKVGNLFSIQGDPSFLNKAWIELLKIVYSKDSIGKIKSHFEYKKEITIPEIIDFMKSKGNLQFWKTINAGDRVELFKQYNYSLYRVGKIFNLDNDPCKVNKAWIELLEIIFGEGVNIDSEIMKKDITKQEIIEFMKSKGNIDHWKDMTCAQRIQSFRKSNYGLGRVGSLFDLNGNPCDLKQSWIDLLELVFGEKAILKQTDKEQIIDFMKSKGDVDFWIKSTGAKRKQLFKDAGFGLRSVGTLFGLKGDPGHGKQDWIELLKIVYGNKKLLNIQIKPKLRQSITKSDVIEFMNSCGPVEYWLNISCRNRVELFNNNGFGLGKVGKAFGINGNPANNNNSWKQLLNLVYKVNETHIK
ncbi:MAG: DEAD/DEAH box helicase family protein [Candidatus Absconditabacteria bacterium]